MVPAAQVATSLKKKNKGQADFVANSLRLGASCQVRMSDGYACLASGSNWHKEDDALDCGWYMCWPRYHVTHGSVILPPFARVLKVSCAHH